MNPLGMKAKGVLLCAACAALLMIAARLVCGCASIGQTEQRRQLAAVIRTAYAAGGRAAVSNRIERLVVDGDVSEAEAELLHQTAQAVYDSVVANLESGGEPDCGDCGDK